MIAVTCSCGRTLRAKGELAGKLAQCPHCQERVLIPDGGASGPEAATTLVDRPAALSRTRLLVGGGVLAAALIAVVVVYFGWFRGKEQSGGGSPVAGAQKSAPTIAASPNPVPAGPEKFGTTTITWDTGDGSVGEVYVAANGAEEKRFSGAKPTGSQDAAWIGKGVYEFRLYAGKEHKTLLASVRVTRNS
jgi:hypothetical protein